MFLEFNYFVQGERVEVWDIPDSKLNDFDYHFHVAIDAKIHVNIYIIIYRTYIL